MAKTQPHLRLATVDGVSISNGYKSGRRRWRDTPDTASTAKTRSAGKPRASQLETVPCELKPSFRAKADCPPTALQALSNAFLLMSPINAHSGKSVNAETVNAALQAMGMGRKAESAPSAFWQRLTEAWSEQGLPISQNGVATKLKMSQGSVGRWFHDEGLPELETCIDIAERGRVCVDWLLTGRAPKYPISKDPVLRELLETCEALHQDGRLRVLRASKGELLQQQGEEQDERQKRAGGALSRAG